MGSFAWDDPCYFQYYNGRPLSEALTQPFETEIAPYTQISPYIERDFAIQYRPRSQSSGRRYKRESYRIYHPNVQYASYFYSPPYSRQWMDHSGARDAFAEKYETVIVEQEQCRPNYGMISYVHAPSPPVRQVKIRSRPSSCFDLHKQEKTVVEERHDEHYNYHYKFNLPQYERVVSVQRESSPKVVHQDATTLTTTQFNIPIVPKPVRPLTRDAATTTAGLPKTPARPLSISETQVIERYETDEKVQREAKIETGSITYTSTTDRPLYRTYDVIVDNSDNQQYQQASKKTQRKEFVQRMHARNGTSSKSYNALNLYSDSGKNQVIIRPTSKPREALVDAPIIVAPPDQSEQLKSSTSETHFQSRSYYQNT